MPMVLHSWKVRIILMCYFFPHIIFIIEQLLVETSLDSCLSQHDSFPIPFDKDKFYENDYAAPMYNHATCVLEPNNYAESRHVIHIASKESLL